jgi:hypothetical protein
MALLPTLGSDARADSKADCDWADGLGLFIVCRDRVRERESPADRQTARSWLHCLCTASALGQATQAGRQAGLAITEVLLPWQQQQQQQHASSEQTPIRHA